MDLAVDLRTAERRLDEAEQRLAGARQAEVSASRAYDRRRRYAPGHTQTDRARATWGLALVEWAAALVDREKARDQVRIERREVDSTAMTALMGTEKPIVYDPADDEPRT